MLQATVIGVVGFGTDNPPLEVRALQWAYDSEEECIRLVLLGTDFLPLDIISLSNIIPKEFVLKVTKDKRKIKKARYSHILEKNLNERNTVLRELAQYVSNSKIESWSKDKLIKFFQAMEI